MQFFHWTMGFGVLYCFATAQLTHHTKDKELIGKLMFQHKSSGLLIIGLLVPRLAVRLFSRKPPHLPSTSFEKWGAKLSHFSSYVCLTGLSFSGVMMGLYSGNGFPFFVDTFHYWQGPEYVRKDLAGFAYKMHKYGGSAMEYLIALHVGAVIFG